MDGAVRIEEEVDDDFTRCRDGENKKRFVGYCVTCG